MKPTICIIIVNWNAGKYLTQCLESIKSSLYNNFLLESVVIVDNASSDNSLASIEIENLPIKVIKNKENLGFAKACNQGAKGSNADYLLMLNPDTQLFKDSLNIPIEFLEKEENQKIGICGVQLIDEYSNTSRSCTRFPTASRMIIRALGLDKLFPGIFLGHFMTEWNHNDNRIVDQVMGSFFLIRGDLFKELNGYDERFFVYYEDLDLALRANQRGFESFFLADAKIFHKGGGTSEQVKAERLFYNLRSKLLYAEKHFPMFSFILVSFVVLFFEPISRLVHALFVKSTKSVTEIIRAYKKLYLSLFPKWNF